MFRWAAGILRRATGAILLLLLLIFGAEIGLRLQELRTARRGPARSNSLPEDAVTVPSWTAYQELRPVTKIAIADRQGAGSYDLRINSYGLRGPEVDVPKPQSVYRVLCLGDELVLGAAIDEQRHFCAQLQEHLQRQTKLQVEVWNAGVPGACPLTEYLLLSHRLSPLQPDLVLVVVQESDLADDQACRRTTRNDRDGVPLSCRHPSLGRPPRTDPLTAWREEFRLIDVGLRSAGCAWKRKTDEDHASGESRQMIDLSRLRQDRAAIERTLQPLVPLAAWCRHSYASLCVCEVRGQTPAMPAGATSLFMSTLKDLAAAQRFAFCEFAPTVPEEQSARRRGWSADAHREFADRLGPRIVKEIAGPWSSPYFRAPESSVTPASFERRPNATPLMRLNESTPRR